MGKIFFIYCPQRWRGENNLQKMENRWTKDGKYYELHDYDGLTDVYNVKLKGDNKVEYRSVELFGKTRYILCFQ
jgi:hypothetical protein